MTRHVAAVARARTLRVRIIAAAAAIATASIGLVGLAVTPAQAASGHVTGTVFRDFNQNGVFDSTAGADGLVDVGIAGVTATAYDSTGAPVGSAVSTSDGSYDVPISGSLADGAPIRLAFSGYSADFVDSAVGTGNGSSVQFVKVGDVGANFGLHTLDDYSGGSATPVITLLEANGLSTGPSSASAAITAVTPAAATHSNAPTVATTLATFGEVGAVWGSALQSLGNGHFYLYVASVLKRHSGFGPKGIAGLYRIDLTVASNGTITRNALTSVDLSTPLGANSYGTVARDLVDHGSGKTLDAAAFAASGKVGIGGIAYANGKLYVTNLSDRKVYAYDTANFAAAPTAITLPLTASERPWALSTHDGSLYVGVTDTANVTTGARVLSTSLTGTPSFSAALTIPLNYQRGIAWDYDYPTPKTTGTPQAQWHPWNDDYATLWTGSQFTASIPSFRAWAQPILSSLAFDEGGNVVLGFADRFSLQGGASNIWPDWTTSNGHNGATVIPNGDILYAGWNGTSYALENNGSVTVTDASNQVVTRVSSLGTPAPGETARRGIQGPGGEEFFEDSVKYDGSGSIIPGEGVVHDETTLGAVALIPGSGRVVSTSYDAAQAYDLGGNRWLSLFDGQSVDGFNQYANAGNVYFAKSGGLGSIAVILADSPIQIGNRVWFDANRNGIQDADEPAIVGATVKLLSADGSSVLGTTTTNSAGVYLFDSRTTPAITANSSYQLEFDAPTGAVTLSGANANAYPGLVGSELQVTAPDAGTDVSIDSDPAVATGRVSLTTGALGQDNHTYDAGFFRKSYAIGDRVWLDTNKNGVQDAGETGLAGVTVTLLTAGGVPVAGVAAQTTTSTGLYLFDGLPAGSYRVSFSLPAGYYRTVVGGSGSTAATDSDASTSTGTTGVIVLSDATVVSTYAGQTVTASQGIDPNWDAGYVTYSPAIHVVKADAAGNDANTTGTAVDLQPTGGSTGLVFTIHNTGDEALTNVTVTDAQAVGSTGTVSGIVCTLPGGSGTMTLPWAGPFQPDASFICTANLDGVTAGSTHLDTVTVDGVGVISGTGVHAHDPYNATARSYAIGDRVWLDEDGDGIQDSGEPSLAGVTVTLLDAAGAPVAGVPSQTTTANGLYLFDNLDAGTYHVRFDLPVNYSFTTASALDAGSPAPSKDSDAVVDSSDPQRGQTGPIVLGSGSVLVSSAAYPAQTFSASEGIDPTWDAGVIPGAVSVGDFVWIDSNRDGLQDVGEPGIPGVVLKVTGPGGAPVTNVFGDVVGPVTTNASGAYEFTHLPPLSGSEKYTVTIDTAASAVALTGYTPTLEGAGGGAGANDSSTLSADSVSDLTHDGARDATLDFGYVGRTYALGDVIWVDHNKDGVQDSGEPPLSGVTVTLLDSTGNPVSGVPTQVTASDGRYLFDNLAAGTYRVRFELSAADAVTKQFTVVTASGATAATDSDATPTGPAGRAETGDIVLGASDTALTTSYDRPVTATEGIDPTWDAGVIIRSVSVGDRVWRDLNRDGVQDVGEPGIDGVVLELLDTHGDAVTDGSGHPVTTTTSGGGNYSFDGLPALPAGDSYEVRIAASDPSTIAALDGLLPTLAHQAGDTARDSSTNDERSGDLVSDGATDTTLDFGFVAKSYAVGDAVWVDSNGDGVHDAGELPLAGVKVSLRDAAGNPVTDVFGAAVASTTTDAAGRYLFDQLPAGHYSIAFTLTSGQALLYRFTTADAAAATDATDSDADSSGVISDFLLDDSTAGLTTTYTPSVLASQGIDSSRDAGVVPNAVSVGDFVWVDSNDNGTQDAGEPGIPGVVLDLTGPHGAVVDVLGNTVNPVTTNASGAYLFDALPPLAAGETYTVTIDASAPSTHAALAGYRAAQVIGGGTGALDSSAGFAESQQPLLSNGDHDLTLDFGFVPKAVAVGDLVWNDQNRDGIQDAGEPGIPGVTVLLTGPGGGAVTSVDGDAVGPAVTDANGLYSFGRLPSLPAGQHYTVTVDSAASSAALANYLPTVAGAGSNPARDSSTGSAESGNLVNDGDHDLTLDFGYITKTYALGDRVWVDKDGQGDQDAGEASLGGVTVTLLQGGTRANDVFGNPVADVVTGADGAYLFDQLAAGSYVVKFTLPSGYRFTTQDAVASDAIDSDASVSTGKTATIALDDSDAALGARAGVAATQGIDPTWDAGVVPFSVEVGDFVWVDSNGDGLQGASEEGLPGVHLVLTGPTGASVTDVFGDAVSPAVTAGDGSYHFANLPPLAAGQHYTVTIDQAASSAVLTPYKASPALQGSDRGVDSSTGSAASAALINDGDSDETLDFGFVPYGPAITIVKRDDAGNDANDAATAVDLTSAGGATGLRFTIHNSGDEPLINVAVSDAVTAGSGVVTGLLCTFPDSSTGLSWAGPFSVGASFECTANLASVAAGIAHTDLATVVGIGEFTAGHVTDHDPYNAFVAKRVSVGDFVFEDLNGDGIQDSGEPGIAGVRLTLRGPSGPVTDVFGALVGAATTDSHGAYAFVGLPVLNAGESYTVSIDTVGSSVALAPFRPTLAGVGNRASDSSTDSASSLTLTDQGDSDTTLDFGFVRRTYALGDRVWVDENHNGIQDAAEPGLPGVVVALMDSTGTVIAHDTTDSSGRYLFDQLLPGTYRVAVELSANQALEYRFTDQDAGASDLLDSDVSASTGVTNAIVLDASTVTRGYTDQAITASDGIDPSWDAGLIRRSYAVGDLVWLDSNENGVQDPGEMPVADVTVTLYRGDGTVDATTTTNAAGRYLFDDLPPASYSIGFTAPAGYRFTAQTVGDSALDSNADTTSGRTAVFALGNSSVDPSYASQPFTASEGVDSTWDAGLIALKYAIGDRVWMDSNHNGLQDSGEASVAGVTVILYDSAGVEMSRETTDSVGHYLFDNLAAGKYSIRFQLSSTLAQEYTFAADRSGSDADVDSDADQLGQIKDIVLGPDSPGLVSDASVDGATATGGVDPTWDVGLVKRVSLATTGVQLSWITIALALLMTLLGAALCGVSARRLRLKGRRAVGSN